MARNWTVRHSIGMAVLLILGVISLYLAKTFNLTWSIPFILGWVCFYFFVYFWRFIKEVSLPRITMYLLLITTFLNQSVISIDLGIFTLFLYRVILIIAIFLYCLQAYSRRTMIHDYYSTHLQGVWLFFGGWVAYGMVSLLWAASIIQGVKYMSLLVMGIAFIYLAAITFKQKKQLLSFFVIWMGMTVFLLVLGLINHFFAFQLPTSSLYGASSYKLSYPTAVFFNQNDFAMFLSISFFFFIATVKNSRKEGIRMVALLLSILTLYVMYLTESRASLLAVIAGGCTYVFLLLNRRAKKMVLISCLVAVIVGGIFLTGKVYTKVQTYIEVADSYEEGETLPSNVARVNLLRNTMYYVVDTYGLGVGAGNIPYYLETRSIFPTGNVLQVHNWFAEIVGNFGVAVLLGYIGLLIYLFSSLYRFYQEQRKREDKMLLEASMIGLIAFLIASISPSSVSNLYFHWVFLGFIICVVSFYKQRSRKLQWKIEMQGEKGRFHT